MEINSRPKCVHVCVNNDQHKGDDQVEDQPNVNHLNVGGLWEVLRDGYEHGGKDQHHRQVDCYDSLEEEGFEVVGHVGDDDEEHGGDVDGKDSAKETPESCQNSSE